MMETYLNLKLYNHLKYERVLTWINPYLDLHFKNYVYAQGLNVNLVHSLPIKFESPSTFYTISNVTITNSYQYLLSNWVNLDLYYTNPYCNDILNIKSYSLDVRLDIENYFYNIKSHYTFGNNKLIKEENLFVKFDSELYNDFFNKNAHLYKGNDNNYYYSTSPISKPDEAVSPILLTYSMNKMINTGLTKKYTLNNLPVGRVKIDINNFSFYYPERGSGYLSSKNISSLMEITDLESVAFGLLSTINYDNSDLALSNLQGVINFYLNRIGFNFIGFPYKFNKYNYTVVDEQLLLYENAILGYAICKVLNYLQDRPISRIVKLSDALTSDIVSCLDFISNFIILTRNEYTGFLTNGLTTLNTNSDNYSVKGMVSAYFFLQERLKIKYNATIHLFTAGLEVKLTELNPDLTNSFYAIFNNNEDIITNACFLAWFYKMQNNQQNLEFIYNNYLQDIVTYTEANKSNQILIKDYILLGLICCKDFTDDYLYYKDYLNSNTEFDPVYPAPPKVILKARTILHHTLIMYVNKEQGYLLNKPFNTKGLELELYKSYLVDNEAIMFPKGLKWPILDVLEDPSTVIGSIFDVAAKIADKNYLDYALLIEGLEINNAQGFVLDYYSDIHFPKPGLVSDSYWQLWLAEYVNRPRETREAINFLCDLFGEVYPNDYSDSTVSFEYFHDNLENLATSISVNLRDVGQKLYTYIKQIEVDYTSKDNDIPLLVDKKKVLVNRTKGLTHYFDGSYDEIIHDKYIVTGDSNYAIEPLGKYLGIVVFCQFISPTFYKSLKETLPLGIKIVSCPDIFENISPDINIEIEFYLIKDTIPPTVAITMSDYSIHTGGTAIVTFTFSETPLLFILSDIVVQNGTISNLIVTENPRVYTALFTPDIGIQDNTNVIIVGTGYTDIGGNIGISGVSPNFTIDTVSPTVEITMSDYTLIQGETAIVTFTFSQKVMGFTIADIIAQNGTLTDFTITSDPLIYTATFTPTDNIEDNTNVISVTSGYTDLDSNIGIPNSSTNYIIDTIAPTVTITLSDTALVTGDTATVTFTFSQAITGFIIGDITAENGTLSDLVGTINPLVYKAILTPNLNVNDSTNRITVIGSSYKDILGNFGLPGISPNYTINTIG